MNVETRLRAGAGLPDAPPPQGADAAIVGVGLARALAVSPGDTMTLMVSTVDGSLNAVDVTVTGLFSTGLQELDARMLQVHLLSAQRALGTPQVTSLLVGVTDGAPGRRVEAALTDGARAAVARRSRRWGGRCARRSTSRCAGSTSASSCSSARSSPCWSCFGRQHAAHVDARAHPRVRHVARHRHQPAPAGGAHDARGQLAGAHRRRRGLRDRRGRVGGARPARHQDAAAARRGRSGRPGADAAARATSRGPWWPWWSSCRWRRCPPSCGSFGCASWTRSAMSERASVPALMSVRRRMLRLLLVRWRSCCSGARSLHRAARATAARQRHRRPRARRPSWRGWC